MRAARGHLVVLAVVVVGVLASAGARDAAAEGERSPMFGGAIVATSAPEHDVEIVGAQLELVQWWWRFGLAVEGSRRWDVTSGDPVTTTIAASARVLVYDSLVHSLFEPRDVELGVELHAIAERAWWTDEDPANAYGFGVALRLRGGGDAWFSTLLAESRLFVRVMTTRAPAMDAIARTTMPAITEPERMVVLGLGAAWGTGHDAYVDRFRLQWPDSPFAER